MNIVWGERRLSLKVLHTVLNIYLFEENINIHIHIITIVEVSLLLLGEPPGLSLAVIINIC